MSYNCWQTFKLPRSSHLSKHVIMQSLVLIVPFSVTEFKAAW